ncbi:MAG: aldehyde dehydrogenase [Phycisphaeraceae bacterium]
MDQATLIQTVVQQVLQQLNQTPAAPSVSTSGGGVGGGKDGLFDNVDAAVIAAKAAFRKLSAGGLDMRDGIIKLIKKLVVENSKQWGRIELEETKVGRLDHKITKLEILPGVPGVEYLRTAAHSGDDGITLDELAPWGVIGAITPVTHSIPTLTANAVSMIAAGNAVIFNPHPSGANCAALAVQTYNRAIAARFGIENLLCIIIPPTLRTAEEIFRHDDIPLLVATGGPGVARAAMKQTKRAIVAGPGNPPVVIDETADLDNAARSIITGGGFDNNLLCIGEKEVFVVESVFDQMMAAMERAGAVRLTASQIAALTKAAFVTENGHTHVSKDFVGKDCSVLSQAAGMSLLNKNVDLLFGETDESNPFVPEEQMMPFVPFVRVPHVDRAIELAIKHEHGFGHTAIIHSNNLNTITRMGKVMNTTLFVVNGPSTAGLGIGGEGYLSYSIATPTGEGITTPLSFTRFRRATIAGALRVI